MKRRATHTRREVMAWSAAAALAGLQTACGSSSGPGGMASRRMSLHIVAPNGSFAWWQLLWPHVEVAMADMPGPGGLAYHESAAAGTLFAPNASTDDRAWFASSSAPWIDINGDPYPGMELSCFMAGRDETHTQFPTTAVVISGTADLLAGAAAIQVQESSAVLPVIGVQPIDFGQAPGAPTPAVVPNADGLVDLFDSVTTPTGLVTPTPADQQLFGIDGVLGAPDDELSPAQRQGLFEWGRRMIVTAKAMALGLTDAAMFGMTSGAIADTSFVDPHLAFQAPADLVRTRNVVQVMGRILEGFHQLLASVPDPAGGGRTLIDNVVITVHGDTPHTPLQSGGWPDATPDACNWIYVVGKGHLKHGWFGRVHTTLVNGEQVSGFDGATGADVPGQASDQGTAAANAAILYAITRGRLEQASAFYGAAPPDIAGLVRS